MVESQWWKGYSIPKDKMDTIKPFHRRFKETLDLGDITFKAILFTIFDIMAFRQGTNIAMRTLSAITGATVAPQNLNN